MYLLFVKPPLIKMSCLLYGFTISLGIQPQFVSLLKILMAVCHTQCRGHDLYTILVSIYEARLLYESLDRVFIAYM